MAFIIYRSLIYRCLCTFSWRSTTPGRVVCFSRLAIHHQIKTTVLWNKPSFLGGQKIHKNVLLYGVTSHALIWCSKYAVAYLTMKRKTNYVNQYWGEFLLYIYLFYFLRLLRWVSTKSSTRSKLNYNHEICICLKTSHALVYITFDLEEDRPCLWALG